MRFNRSNSNSTVFRSAGEVLPASMALRSTAAASVKCPFCSSCDASFTMFVCASTVWLTAAHSSPASNSFISALFQCGQRRLHMLLFRLPVGKPFLVLAQHFRRDLLRKGRVGELLFHFDYLRVDL